MVARTKKKEDELEGSCRNLGGVLYCELKIMTMDIEEKSVPRDNSEVKLT